jgi:hypothetical protein
MASMIYFHNRPTHESILKIEPGIELSFHIRRNGNCNENKPRLMTKQEIRF